MAITIVVLVAGIQVGLETSLDFREGHSAFLTLTDLLVTMAFTIEIVVRILGDGDRPAKAMLRPLNLFDLALVVGSWVPMTAGLVSVLRLVRLLRVLRLVRLMPKLQLLIAATLNSIPSILSIAVLLGMHFYVYAVAGVFMFGDNDPVHFRNLPTSLLSLFRVITLEDWTDIMYTQIYGCASYGYDTNPELCTDSKSFAAIGALFFISFVFIGTWVLLNLFIGIILTGMDEARREVEATPLAPGRTLRLLRHLRHSVTRDDSGEIVIPPDMLDHQGRPDLAGVGAGPSSSHMRKLGNGMMATRSNPPRPPRTDRRSGHGDRSGLEAQLLTLEGQIRLLREQVRQDHDTTP